MKKAKEYRHYARYARTQADKAKSQSEILKWLQTANYLDRAALLRLQTLRKAPKAKTQ